MSNLESDRFQRDVALMLLTFFTVAVIDVVVLSLFTHHLRFWFPLWLDPTWETRAEPWVVYSQSYAAGIFMIPLLWRAIDREWLATQGLVPRALYWIVGMGLFAFILWWKGGLMFEHKKELEAIGWLGLTIIVWTALRLAYGLPERLRNLTRRQLLSGLLSGIACFFIGMSVLDPVMQLKVQHLSWSPGLIIEVSFFIPAGITLLWLSRRLKTRN